MGVGISQDMYQKLLAENTIITECTQKSVHLQSTCMFSLVCGFNIETMPLNNHTLEYISREDNECIGLFLSLRVLLLFFYINLDTRIKVYNISINVDLSLSNNQGQWENCSQIHERNLLKS